MTESVEQAMPMSDNPPVTTVPQTTDQSSTVETAPLTDQTTTETPETQSTTVSEAVTAEVEPNQSTPETDKTLPVETANPTEETKSPVKVYRADIDAIEFHYPDGEVACVSAHPPEVKLSNTEGQLVEERSTSNLETGSTDGYAHSDASIISVVEKVNTSSATLKTGPTADNEMTKVELSEEITEPIMHVADPCMEVPEPVGTPQTSRSKVSESRGGDNGPELNMAHLVDAVEIREATVEDIPPAEPVVVEPVNHTDRPKRPPPPSVEKSTHQVVQDTDKSGKKTHGGFHFRFGGSKSRETSATRDQAHQNRRTLGANVRSAFGTLTRSIKKKRHSLEQKKRSSLTASVDDRHMRTQAPGERIVVTVRSPSNGPDYQEEQSLQSVSGVCLSHESSVHGTPNQKRRQLIRSAAHDFQHALPIDDQMTDVTPIYVNHAMQSNYQSDQPNASPIEAETAIAVNAETSADKERVLNWTAASIANSGATYEDSIHEDEIQPVRVERGRPQQVFLSRLVLEDGSQPQPSASSNTVRSPRRLVGDSPKPPRPVSRPVLSPLDYQTFHSEDSLAQPDVVTRRVDMIHAIAPTTEVTTSDGVPYQMTVEQITDVHPDPGQRDAYKVTASLDRRQYDSFERPRPGEMRRAQTMRTADYTSRIRQRLLTFRGDSTDKHDEYGGTLRVSKVRSKPENYVCSETIHFPKNFFKLKRRQTTTGAKQVHSTPNEPIIPRPQPRATLSYQAPSPVLPRPPLQENISVTHTVHVQGKPPRSAPAARMQAVSGQVTPDLSMRSPRQLTSLQTLAASPKAQRCTALPESPQRGLIQMMDTALGSPKQMHDVTSFPYLSKELMVQVSQSDQGLKVDATTLQNYSDGPLIEASLKQVHPFLGHRADTTQKNEDVKTPTDTDSKENIKPCIKSCMQNFLNTCVRLKSVDLQGHYAAFHYPLRAFNSALWSSRARFVDWNNLHVIQEPGYITEYVELPPAHQAQGFMYADKPIDALLTNWLDCHQTTPPSDVGCHSPNTSRDKAVHLYHPISFAVRLDQLLAHTEGTQNEEVYDTCFRLATLLSYAYCLKCLEHQKLSSNSITSDPNQILVVLSTSNCLILFKKHQTDAAESSTAALVKSISPDHESIEQAVDALIHKLGTITKAGLEKMDCSSQLLQAVAPPDWMAICCSRIYLKQQ